MDKMSKVSREHPILKYEATAIILAGGRSTRLGFDKQLLMHKNRYLIDLLIDTLRIMFQEVIIVSNRPELYAHRDIRVVSDHYVGVGPLAGFHAGLTAASFPICYVTACDMPWISASYVHYLMKKYSENPQKSIWVTRRGTMLEPLGGLYQKQLAESAAQLIQVGERRIQALFTREDVEYIPERTALHYSPNWHMFDNINTQEDLHLFKQLDREAENHVQIDGNQALGK